MVRLTPFGFTWDGDWTLFSRMAAAYVQELSLPGEALLQAELRTLLIRRGQQQSDALLLRKVLLDGGCAGFLCCRLHDAQGEAELLALTLQADRRRQGHGRQTLHALESELRRRGISRIRLRPDGDSRAFWLSQGFSGAGETLEKDVPRHQAEGVQLLVYTRQALHEDIYAPKLADSVHLALIENGLCTPLMHNSGVVYAKAVPGEMGVLHPYSLRRPWLTRLPDGQWALLAQRIECDGSPDAASEDHVLFFTSDDLIHYAEQPLLHMSDPLAQEYLERRLHKPDLAGLDLPEGCIPGNAVPLSEECARRLRTRFLTPVNVANDVPASVEAASPAELSALRATARYSDGSTVLKRVEWDVRAVDWTKPGDYPIEGRVHQDRYEFPTAWSKADPAVCRWQGKYYFISTNDLDGNNTLFIREADSLPALATAQQTCILDTTMYPHLGSLLWAPEMHIIRQPSSDGPDRLCIFHAGTPGPFGQEQSHVMALRPGGNPLKAADWSMPRRVVKKDGSPLYDKGITLDMTVFWSAGRLYACWSQRQFDPVDLGAWLYIAELDPDEPWRLLSDPQVLTKPEYGWENNHTFVAEGPFALVQNGRILLTYSGALVDSTYVVGLLSMPDGADPLDPASWTKENYPLLSSRSVPGEYGPGHNAYVIDGDGLIWNTYHARPGIRTEDGRQGFGPRSSGIRRVHMNAEGFPILDMTEEMDLNPALAWVRTTVHVR